MINSLLRNNHLRRDSQRRACIEVPVIFRKRTGTNLQADTMSNFEDLCGIPTIELDAISIIELDGVPHRPFSIEDICS